jgi:hypothetical protein
MTTVVDNLAANNEPEVRVEPEVLFTTILVGCNLSYLLVTRNFLFVKYHVPHVDAVMLLWEDLPLLMTVPTDD